LNLDQAKQRREQLASAIAAEVRAFESETGLIVRGIVVQHGEPDYSRAWTTYSAGEVRIEVEARL
jgi:hypothetical protein